MDRNQISGMCGYLEDCQLHCVTKIVYSSGLR